MVVFHSDCEFIVHDACTFMPLINQSRCTYYHIIRIVRILLLLLCLAPVSEQLESIGPLQERCSKFKLKLKSQSTDSMRRGAGRGAGRGKPDGPKRLPISLGFKCAHCRNEFDSRHAMDIHRRHSSSFGTPCADPRNHMSISFTERGDQAARIILQQDTLGVLPIPAFVLLRKCRLCLLDIVINVT